MNNSTSSIFDSLASSSEDQPYQPPLSFILDFRFFLVRVFYPSLLIWGIIGNALCLRVLLSKKFVKNSTCQYLAVLAVIDILFIVMRSSKHVYKLFRDTTIFNTSKWVCRILTFFSSALAHMASWILVIVSFDRYLIVTSRYHRRSSAVNRVLCSTSILVAIVALCNLYYFFILGRSMTLGGHGLNDQRRVLLRLLFSSNETIPLNFTSPIPFPSRDFLRFKTTTIFVCIPSIEYETFFRTYIPVFDVLLVAAIPFLLLCFTNTGIIVYTMRANRAIRQHGKHAHRRHQRLTIMLLSVTLAFIGLTCPSVIFICLNKIIYSRRILNDRKDGTNDNPGLGPPAKVQLVIDICEALWYTKHAMNFILYTLSGQDFRREFLKLFTQCCRRRALVMRKLLKNDPSITRTPIALDLTLVNTHDALLSGRSSQKAMLSDVADPSSVAFLDSRCASVTDGKRRLSF